MKYDELTKEYDELMKEYKELFAENELNKEKIQKLERAFAAAQRQDDFKTVQKIQKAKQDLQHKNLKMTGWNNFNKYNYFDLKDITQPITDVLIENGLASKFLFYDDIAYLRIYSETGYCEWQTPLNALVSDKVKDGKDYGALMKINQGVRTYARRTLWMEAMEITEHVEIEDPTPTQKTHSKNKSKTQTRKAPSADQLIQPIKEPKDEEVTEEKIKKVLDTAYDTLTQNGYQFNTKNANNTIKKLCKNNNQLYTATMNALKIQEEQT